MRNGRAGFWVALVIALLVTGHAYWDFFESRRLRTRLEAVKASGAPVSIATVAYLTGATADSDRFYRAASVLAGGVRSSASPQAEIQLGQALRQGTWTPDLTAVLRARLEKQRDALALVDRAAPLPFEGFQAGWRPAYGAGAYTALQGLCEMRAVERTLAGDSDGAFDSLYSDVRLERVVGRPPMFAGLAFVAERAKP